MRTLRFKSFNRKVRKDVPSMRLKNTAINPRAASQIHTRRDAARHVCTSTTKKGLKDLYPNKLHQPVRY